MPGADGSLYGMALSSARLSRRAVDFLQRSRPDALVLWADRYELLPVAMAASYLNIPIAHLQGFETSGNIDNKVRAAISGLADMHFVAHEYAAIKARESCYKNIFNYGCPSLDMINEIEPTTNDNPYVIVMWHPHTNEVGDLENSTLVLLESVVSFCNEHNLDIVWFKSNNDAGYNELDKALVNVNRITNVNGEEFIRLLKGCKMIVGNSSACIRESSYIGKPAVLVGDRQNGRVHDENVISVNTRINEIKEGMSFALKYMPERSTLFGDGNASNRIVSKLKEWLNGSC
jgi:UDP-hydrolysing UDP-N-acetyl-D-glucosamine 2-epimerase